MGASASSTTVLEGSERDALSQLTGSTSFGWDHKLWDDVVSFKRPLHHVDPAQVFLSTRNFCDRLARNNATTRNLNTLLGHVLHRLGRVEEMPEPEILNTVNGLFLARTFLKYLVEVGEPAVVVAQLDAGITPGTAPTGVATIDSFTAKSFTLGLVDFLSLKDVLPTTYDVHLEVLNTLLVLLSTQLKATEMLPPPGFGPGDADASVPGGGSGSAGAGAGAGGGAGSSGDRPVGHDPFLEIIMASGSETTTASLTPAAPPTPASGAPSIASLPRASRLVLSLLHNFVRRTEAPAATAAVHADIESKLAADAEASGSKAQEGGGVLGTVGAAASSLILLPWQLYSYLFPHQPKSFPVANRSVLLLLLLTHNCRSRGWQNPYRTELCSVSDIDGHTDDGDQGTIQIRMGDVFTSLCQTAHTPSGTVLLYTLFHGNPAFMNFLLARTDLDALLMPLLQQLYSAPTLKPFQRYILLIVFLLFTQDGGFCDNVHQRMEAASVPWFQERILTDIKLGSLTLVMLLRTVQYNLTNLQDGYMHTTSFAALANMSPHSQDLHPYAAQRVVGVLYVLVRKYERLSARLMAANREKLLGSGSATTSSTTGDGAMSAETTESLTAALDSYAQLLHILLEIVLACLAPRVLRHNLHLVYTLMHRRSILEPLQSDPRFSSLVEGVVQVLGHFDVAVRTETAKGRNLAEEDVLELLQANCQSWRGGADAAAQAAALADTKFTYDEEACPEDFFVPYVWALALSNTRDLQWDADLIKLFPASDADLDIPVEEIEASKSAAAAAAAAAAATAGGGAGAGAASTSPAHTETSESPLDDESKGMAAV